MDFFGSEMFPKCDTMALGPLCRITGSLLPDLGEGEPFAFTACWWCHRSQNHPSAHFSEAETDSGSRMHVVVLENWNHGSLAKRQKDSDFTLASQQISTTYGSDSYSGTSSLCFYFEFVSPRSLVPKYPVEPCYLKDRRNPPHVDEPRAKVLPGREEEGEEGDPKAERQQQELDKVMFMMKRKCCWVCQLWSKQYYLRRRQVDSRVKP